MEEEVKKRRDGINVRRKKVRGRAPEGEWRVRGELRRRKKISSSPYAHTRRGGNEFSSSPLRANAHTPWRGQEMRRKKGRGRKICARGGTREREEKKERRKKNREETKRPHLVMETIAIRRGMMRENMVQNKKRGCGCAPLLVTEFFSITREGEASERRRRRKKKR